MPLSRRWQLALAVSATLVLATTAAGFSQAASPQHAHQHAHEHAAGALNARQLAFHDRMRKLWEDHITWTRLAIVSFDANLPDQPATDARLLQNQADIGHAIAPFYGAAAGRKLTALLRAHILIAVDILGDAKSGNAAKLAVDQHRWLRNGDAIAAFLHAANPRNWSLAEARTMMRTHLRLTAEEAIAHLRGDNAADVRAYDAVHHEILGMADMLSNGIMRQFPGRFN